MSGTAVAGTGGKPHKSGGHGECIGAKHSAERLRSCAILPGMAFKVWIVDEEPADCGDGDMYEFLAGGILAIHYSTPGRWSDYYQPTVWRRVAAQPNHRPGEPADTSIGPDFE
ncbi:MAG: hypothetical protein QOE41_2881 [Mycobacterium sp.]|jgi:hypothetical protein|nr:hypothetical protein [Mycobacterium sp.]